MAWLQGLSEVTQAVTVSSAQSTVHAYSQGGQPDCVPSPAARPDPHPHWGPDLAGFTLIPATIPCLGGCSLRAYLLSLRTLKPIENDCI